MNIRRSSIGDNPIPSMSGLESPRWSIFHVRDVRHLTDLVVADVHKSRKGPWFSITLPGR